MTDLIIIGGGASGMMAGILAARAGLSVMILEKNRQFGKKLSVTGNGRCNFTNAYQDPACYRSSTPELAWKILQQFPVKDTLAFMNSIGIEYKEKQGYYYPMSEAAGDVVKVFIDELSALRVKCKTNLPVTGIRPTEGGFLVSTEGYDYEAKKVLLTTGGLAAPQHGTEGDGYRMAQEMGHRLEPLYPALTALRTGDHLVTTLAGLRHTGTISLYGNRKNDRNLLAQDTGEIQFATYGISGIPAMQVSRYAAASLAQGDGVHAEIDFCPEVSAEELRIRLHNRKKTRSARPIQEWLIGWLPEKVIRLLLMAAGIDGKRYPEDIRTEEWECLIRQMKSYPVPVEAVRDYDTAQTTAGGISLTACGPDLESGQVPGLYFAGEVLDVDGACGGYNLQWAWASAACAVRGILGDR